MEKILTAAEYRALAKRQLDRVEESWQRSDTDGFLSQWANDLSAQLNNKRAELVEAGMKSSFIGLYDGDRRVMARKIKQSVYNAPWLKQSVWLLDDAEAAKYGRKFIPYGEKSRIQKKLGLSERYETDGAWAHVTGEGRGLSGNAWVATYRTGDEWGKTATLCKEK